MSDVIGAGRHRWVPGNRWDLVLDEIADPPPAPTAIIVPYYEQPASLARMYAALELATPPAGPLELVVVDDGSAEPPPPPPPTMAIPTRIVRQRDLGCRPGAARNLGAASTDAEVLVFLDADTLPAPPTVARLAAWPAVLPDVLVVGRRRHVDLTGWTPMRTQAWLGGTGEAPEPGPDPAWLDRGYVESHDLLDVDRRSYRFVISAVMACHRALYDDLEGFDPTRTDYGSDDWELAHRAFANGAVLAHDPTAVGWHDEPDWSQRDGQVTSRNLQTLWLATVVPEPATRGAIRHHDVDALVQLDLRPDVTAGQVVVTVDSILAALPDAAVALPVDVDPAAAAHLAHDPRIVEQLPEGRHRQRAGVELTLATPALWDRRSLLDLVAAAHADDAAATVHLHDDGDVVATVVARRMAGRARRARALGAPDDVVERLTTQRSVPVADVGLRPLRDEVDLAAHFGGWLEL